MAASRSMFSRYASNSFCLSMRFARKWVSSSRAATSVRVFAPRTSMTLGGTRWLSSDRATSACSTCAGFCPFLSAIALTSCWSTPLSMAARKAGSVMICARLASGDSPRYSFIISMRGEAWHSLCRMAMITSTAVAGLLNLAAISVSILLTCLSSSILLARNFSSAAVRRCTLPISRRYMRTGSSTTSCSSSAASGSTSGSTSGFSSSSHSSSSAIGSGQGSTGLFTSSMTLSPPKMA